MTTVNRRILTAGLLAAIGTPVLAAEDAVFDHRGFTVDMGAMQGDRSAVAGWIRQQIDLVESLNIRDDIKAWFRSIRITVDPALNMPGRFGRNGLTLNDETSPPENPVLLHELLHGYQAQRLSGARDNPQLVAAFEVARASGDWPAQAYMLTNRNEFFAMTASVALWGRAARPPLSRERLRTAMPDWYGFLVDEFGLTT
ncbi:hypothetical protein ACETK8_02250 [Brevundimonas staleyi]|uniref:DUF4157 domain-containing protein n=1 Tax=Brevundimonas staleyi TaxID=74326 RepID=A0ABW0FUR5_9CAUL